MTGTVLVLALAGLVEPQAGPIDVASLLKLMVISEQAHALESERRGLSYTRIQRVDGNPEDRWRVMYQNGRQWYQSTGQNGQPVANAPLEMPSLNMVAAMATRFTLTWADPPIQNESGHLCYVLSFVPKAQEPRSGDKKQSDEEIIVGHLTGTVFIDASGLFIRRIEGRLHRPFRHDKAWINKVTLSLRQYSIEGLPVIFSTDTVAHGSVFIFSSTRHYSIHCQDFVLDGKTVTPRP